MTPSSGKHQFKKIPFSHPSNQKINKQIDIKEEKKTIKINVFSFKIDIKYILKPYYSINVSAMLKMSNVTRPLFMIWLYNVHTFILSFMRSVFREFTIYEIIKEENLLAI